MKSIKSKTKQKKNCNNVLLVDGNFLAFKSYFPIENLEKAKKKFLRATYNLKQMADAGIVSVAFDHDRKENYRYEYSWYKKSRKNSKHRHDEIYKQLLKELPDLLEQRGVKTSSSPKFEADDLIGISSRYFSDLKKNVVIYSGDKDFLQLVGDRIQVWRPVRGLVRKIEIHNCDNFEELNDNFKPYQLRELKGLIGDNSDNIPGIMCLDKEVSKDLIRRFKTIDGIYENLDKISSEVRKILEKKEKIARISLEVGTITTQNKK